MADKIIPTSVTEAPPTVIVSVLGFNPRHEVGVHQPIWDYNNTHQFLTSAQTISIASDNTNDTSAGTGARTLRITGLDSSYGEIEEIISLNGTSTVTTSLSFLRINRIIVDSVGASGINQGNITIQGTSVQGYIIVGQNRARSAIYTIPAGYVGRLKSARASIGTSAGAGGIKQGHLDIFLGEFGKPVRTVNVGFLNMEASSSNGIRWDTYREFDEKTDITLACHTHFENVSTSAFIEIWLEPKET